MKGTAVISFKKFLLGEEVIEDHQEMIDRIKNECASFLKEINFKVYPAIENAYYLNSGSIPRALWRGLSSNAPFIKLPGNKLRQPSDTSPQMHSLLVKHFSNQFGYPYRAMGVFCSSAVEQAIQYGDNLFLVFPIGEYEYIYAPDIDDAYSQFDNHSVDMPRMWDEILSYMGKEENDYTNKYGDVMYDKWFELVYDYLEKTTPYTNNNLRNLLENNSDKGKEVVLKCDNYYALNVGPRYKDTAIQVLMGISK